MLKSKFDAHGQFVLKGFHFELIPMVMIKKKKKKDFITKAPPAILIHDSHVYALNYVPPMNGFLVVCTILPLSAPSPSHPPSHIPAHILLQHKRKSPLTMLVSSLQTGVSDSVPASPIGDVVRERHGDQAVPSLRDPLRGGQEHAAHHWGGAPGHRRVHMPRSVGAGRSHQQHHALRPRLVTVLTAALILMP